MRLAYQRVVENKGAPGVDELAVSEFKDWLKVHWPSVKQSAVGGPVYAASRCAGWTSRSPRAGYAHSGCRRWWTG